MKRNYNCMCCLAWQGILRTLQETSVLCYTSDAASESCNFIRTVLTLWNETPRIRKFGSERDFMQSLDKAGQNTDGNDDKNCDVDCNRSQLSLCIPINLFSEKNVIQHKKVVDISNGVWTNQFVDVQLASGRVIMNLKISVNIYQYSWIVCWTGAVPNAPWEKSLRRTRSCIWSCLICLDQEPSYLIQMK